MQTKLLKYMEGNKKHVISVLSELIAIPTVNPPGENYEEMVFLLDGECRKLGLGTRKYLTPKTVLEKYGVHGGSKRISLVAGWPAGAKKTLHINSHYDVVPPTKSWSTDPFKAVVKSGKVYGRGAEDMKGNIACLLFALQAIKKCGIKPKVNLEISFTPDEETGGRTGLGYLVRKNIVKADYAMSEGYGGSYVAAGNKGVVWAEVTVKGKACHGSMPHLGVNAFERMLDMASEFKKLEEKISNKKTKFSMKDNLAKKPTFVMGGVLKGGVKVNVVPDTASFSIDRRLIPEENAAIARKEIENAVKRFNAAHKDSKASARFMSQENPAISKRDDKFFKVFRDAIMLAGNKKARFCIMPGATDMRYFMWKGVPALGYSAQGGEKWHSDNEFVYIDSLIETAKVYALVMSRLE